MKYIFVFIYLHTLSYQRQECLGKNNNLNPAKWYTKHFTHIYILSQFLIHRKQIGSNEVFK